MKSIKIAEPPAVSNFVSKIAVPSRYFRVTRTAGSTGEIAQKPLSRVPSKALKHASESKRGMQSQSIEPDRLTKAAVRAFPIRP